MKPNKKIIIVGPWDTMQQFYPVVLECKHMVGIDGVGPASQAPQIGFDIPCEDCPDVTIK